MIELHNIDCIKYLKTLEDNAFDLAIVDPPYGIERLKKKGRFTGEGLSWDIKPNKKYFEELFRVSKNQIIWGYNHLSDKLPICTCFIFWDKDISVENYSDGELAWTSFQGVAKKIKIVWDGFRQDNMKNKEVRIHPTQKPVQLYKWLLNKYAKEGQKIFDSHLGSGSIGIACYYYGVDLVGVEIDEKYYNDAKLRIDELTRQETLF